MLVATLARIGNRGVPALFEYLASFEIQAERDVPPFAQAPAWTSRTKGRLRSVSRRWYPRGRSSVVVGRPRRTRASTRLSRVVFGEDRYLLEELRTLPIVEATLGSRREALGNAREPRPRVPDHLGGGPRRFVHQHLHQIVLPSCVMVFETSISSTARPSKRPSRSGSRRRAGGGWDSPSSGRCCVWRRAWWPRSLRARP
jgi:hypothetical protein